MHGAKESERRRKYNAHDRNKQKESHALKQRAVLHEERIREHDDKRDEEEGEITDKRLLESAQWMIGDWGLGILE